MDLSNLFKKQDEFNIIPDYEKDLIRSKRVSNPQDAQLYARFMFAVYYGTVSDLQKVLKLGANPNFIMTDKQTALGVAADNDQLDMVEVLLKAGADTTLESGGMSLLDIASIRSSEIFLRLIEAIPPEKLDVKKLGSQFVTAAFGNGPLIRKLLEIGVPVDTPHPFELIPGHRKTTALMAAAYAGNKNICNLLLQSGADVTRKDSKGNTALDYAHLGIKDKIGNKTTVALLEKAGSPSGPQVKVKRPADDLDAAAQTASFKNLLNQLAVITNKKPMALEGMDGPILGGFGFPLPEKRAREIVAASHETFLKQGAYLFYTSDLMGMQGSAVGILPTTDVIKAVEAMQTEGPNEDVYNKDLLKWLRKILKEEDVRITGMGNDFLEGEFTSPVKDPARMARNIASICSEAGDSPAELKKAAERLAREQKFFLWWD